MKALTVQFDESIPAREKAIYAFLAEKERRVWAKVLLTPLRGGYNVAHLLGVPYGWRIGISAAVPITPPEESADS